VRSQRDALSDQELPVMTGTYWLESPESLGPESGPTA
jgi:hypothetical protein